MIMIEKTVGEIAADMPGSSQIFESHRIDYCCKGKRPLYDACRVVGVNAEEIVAEILVASKRIGSRGFRRWRTESLEELIHYIVEVHHAYLRDELPSLTRMIANLENPRPGHPQAPPLGRAFARLTEELETHMNKEETVLFPAILRIEQAAGSNGVIPLSSFGSVRNPIWMMEQEHDAVASILAELRTLTEDYTLNARQCEMSNVVSQALQSLETDLHEHLHLENNILFPRALHLEAQLKAPG